MTDLPETTARRIIDLCRAMYPVRGLISSPDLDKAFDIIAEALPGTVIHEYPVGTEFEDWIVPRSWECLGGRMTDEDGNVLASTDEHFLFVAPHSEPVDGWFTREEVVARSRTHPDMPECYSLEHRNAYNYQLVDWGITLPHNTRESLRDDCKYHVEIDVRWGNSPLKVAEYFLPGRRPEIIQFCGHIDELVNDDMAGAVLGLELIRGLIDQPDREFSYQMIMVPELFGALFFAALNQEKTANTVGMLNLECVGSGGAWFMKQALRNGEVFEQALRHACRALSIDLGEVDFFDEYGNDERVYSWPTMEVPGVALQRMPFPEYHTHFDTPDLIRLDILAEAVAIGRGFIDVMERNYVPEYTKLLPTWMSRHGVYFDATRDPANFHKYNNIVLFNVNGENSILELAAMADLPFDDVWRYLEAFRDIGAIRKKPLPFPDSPLKKALESADRPARLGVKSVPRLAAGGDG